MVTFDSKKASWLARAGPQQQLAACRVLLCYNWEHRAGRDEPGTCLAFNSEANYPGGKTMGYWDTDSSIKSTILHLNDLLHK